MKKQKKRYSIIVLILLLLALAVGYAAFSGTLTINGTAVGTGEWDVHFKSAILKDANGDVDTEHGTAKISTVTTTDDTITANVTLAYPGDAVMLEAIVENSGNLPAKLTSFNIEGADDDLLITTAGPSEEEILAANGGTCTAEFAIQWAPDSTATELNKTFTVTYEYEQGTTTVELTPQHSDTP